MSEVTMANNPGLYGGLFIFVGLCFTAYANSFSLSPEEQKLLEEEIYQCCEKNGVERKNCIVVAQGTTQVFDKTPFECQYKRKTSRGVFQGLGAVFVVIGIGLFVYKLFKSFGRRSVIRRKEEEIMARSKDVMGDFERYLRSGSDEDARRVRERAYRE